MEKEGGEKGVGGEKRRGRKNAGGAERKSRRWEEEKVVVEIESCRGVGEANGKDKRWSKRCGEGRRKRMSGGGGGEGKKRVNEEKKIGEGNRRAKLSR